MCHRKMSVLHYFNRCSGDVMLPDSEGELSRRIPSNAISSANCHMANNHHNLTYVFVRSLRQNGISPRTASHISE